MIVRDGQRLSGRDKWIDSSKQKEWIHVIHLLLSRSVTVLYHSAFKPALALLNHTTFGWYVDGTPARRTDGWHLQKTTKGASNPWQGFRKIRKVDGGLRSYQLTYFRKSQSSKRDRVDNGGILKPRRWIRSISDYSGTSGDQRMFLHLVYYHTVYY